MKLLASSPTKDGILKLITQFYCGSSISISEVSPDNYIVANSKGKIEGVCVKLSKGRYRFFSEGKR